MQDRIAQIITRAGFKFNRVSAYGRQLVIDTNQKDKDGIVGLITAAGWRLKLARDGEHMDGTSGMRLWFVLEG